MSVIIRSAMITRDRSAADGQLTTE